MIDAPPEPIDAAPDDLRSLCSTLTGYGLVGTRGLTWGLWLLRGKHPPLLVTSVSRDIVFKFEVFTLALRTPEQLHTAARESRPQMEEMVEQLKAAGAEWAAAQPLPEHFEPENVSSWPFANWRVDVLWKREWTIPLETVPDEWWKNPATHFGAAPFGFTHACLVARGLLFTGDDGSRLLISQGEMPLDLLVTRDEEQIQAELESTLAVEMTRCLVNPAPET
ncbi:hypothetical protein [Sphingomonas sp. T9W2]|uniref:hypothetical protein n=1 Tax=Sphingomonas sp. T9W2 TaxID=3143183 RepID=UPI0031F523F4